MSYDIYIGEGAMEALDPEDGWETPYPRVVDGRIIYYRPIVRELELPEAPCFPNDEMTGHGNHRHPGYSAWSDWCEEVGLYRVFFDRKHGLMREHPGFALLLPWHGSCIHEARLSWERTNPGAVPGFEAFSWDEDVPIVGYDPILARLMWLDWWISWALEHCEQPAIYNR